MTTDAYPQGDSPWHSMLGIFQAQYGRTRGLWLAQRVGRDIRNMDLSCLDNFRTCYGPKQSKSYREARERGCCGFFDKEYLFMDGICPIYFWVGFNYGH